MCVNFASLSRRNAICFISIVSTIFLDFRTSYAFLIRAFWLNENGFRLLYQVKMHTLIYGFIQWINQQHKWIANSGNEMRKQTKKKPKWKKQHISTTININSMNKKKVTFAQWFNVINWFVCRMKYRNGCK